MTTLPRRTRLPVAASLAVALVVGVQLANGGGRFEPLATADPCVERPVTSQSDGVEGLTERVVLIGIDKAACRLGVSREALTLDLARSSERGDTEVDALRAGFTDAVEQMKGDGTLPKASSLVDEALDSANLNGLLERAIRALPNGVIDSALETDDVLVRAIDDLDLRALLANLDDEGDLDRQVNAAVTQAVKDALAARMKGLV